MAARPLVFVCSSEFVIDAGDGVRFDVSFAGRAATAFVVRWQGQALGFLNQCAHVAMELDWTPGRFFDVEGTVLVCATHGALYDPHDGRCVGGPCRGRGGLRRIGVVEDEKGIWWQPDDVVQTPVSHESSGPSHLGT